MTPRPDTMPEGTDSIIGGASDQGTAEQIETATAAARGPAERFREEAAGLTGPSRRQSARLCRAGQGPGYRRA